jgi:hypothetical protein
VLGWRFNPFGSFTPFNLSNGLLRAPSQAWMNRTDGVTFSTIRREVRPRAWRKEISDTWIFEAVRRSRPPQHIVTMRFQNHCHKLTNAIIVVNYKNQPYFFSGAREVSGDVSPRKSMLPIWRLSSTWLRREPRGC